jgi:hypothetical protein
MTSTPGPTDRSTRPEFANQAELPPSGLVSELWGLTRHHKKWWLTPIIAVLLLTGLLVMLSGTAAAPFIYALF